MNDTTDLTAPDYDGTTDPRQSGLSVNDAADRLGITPDAVRARIRRGTLYAEKQGNLWRVHLSETTRHDTHETVSRHDTTDRTVAQGHDLAPLTALLADVMKQNADLAAAAAVWQDRAAHLEEQLRQLQAGDTIAAPEHVGAHAEVETYRARSETGAEGILARLKRWLAGDH